MNEFTLLNFSDSTESEKNHERLTQFNETQEHIVELKAPDNKVANVLNYSKALSVRNSTNLNFIENVMN